MTTRRSVPATTRHSDQVWPAAVSAEAAVRTVTRRLPPGAELTARLYHHPFLGMMFLLDAHERQSRWRPPPRPVIAAVVVDLVSCRASLTDPWDREETITRSEALVSAQPGHIDAMASPGLSDPTPRHTEIEAVEAARALLPALLARRRRLDPLAPAELTGPPVPFGKPNWWVTGRAGDREVKVVVDALSGRHYAHSA